jgi:hypothetical protein
MLVTTTMSIVIPILNDHSRLTTENRFMSMHTCIHAPPLGDYLW